MCEPRSTAGAILLLLCIYQVHVSEGASPGRKLRVGKLLSEDIDVANPDVVSYWNKKLENTPMPGSMPSLVSQLSSAEVDRYWPIITSRDLLNATHDSDAAAFCQAAGLICSPAGQHQEYSDDTDGGREQPIDWHNRLWTSTKDDPKPDDDYRGVDWHNRLWTSTKDESKQLVKPDEDYRGIDWHNRLWTSTKDDSKQLVKPDEDYRGVDWHNRLWKTKDDSTQKNDLNPTFLNWTKADDSTQRNDPDPTPLNWWWTQRKPKPPAMAPSRNSKAPAAFSEVALSRARQVYFLLKDMPTAGAKAPGVLFTGANGSLAGAYLPRKLATALRDLGWESQLRALRVPLSSRWAAAIAATRTHCDDYSGDLGTEQRVCARSLEDVADFVSDQLPGTVIGGEMSGVVLGAGQAGTGFFKVVKVEERSSASRANVLCHTMGSFPYNLQACHYIEETELHSVTLQSVLDPTVSVSNIVACHTNTSTFRPDHIAFQVLGVKPGEAGVCHWTRAGTTAFFATR